MYSFLFILGAIFSSSAIFSALSAEKVLRLEEFKPRRSQTVGKKITLLCSIQEGSGPLRFEWFKDGLPLRSFGANYQIRSVEDNSLLIIDPLAPNDAGNYDCTVSNSAGQSSHQMTMIIVKGF